MGSPPATSALARGPGVADPYVFGGDTIVNVGP